jgi:hypothetical protein
MAKKKPSGKRKKPARIGEEIRIELSSIAAYPPDRTFQKGS